MFADNPEPKFLVTVRELLNHCVTEATHAKASHPGDRGRAPARGRYSIRVRGREGTDARRRTQGGAHRRTQGRSEERRSQGEEWWPQREGRAERKGPAGKGQGRAKGKG